MSEPVGAPGTNPDEAWARCERYISDALEYADGTHTAADILRGLETGQFQLWPGPNSAIVTEIIQYPQLRAVNFFLAGGTLPELKAMLPGILEWAKRHMGCTRATLSGRYGWARSFLQQLGWSTRGIVMGVEI